MTFVHLLLGGLILSLLFSCGLVDNGQQEAQKQAQEAQRQAVIQQCQQTYTSCQGECSKYWLGSDKESCLNRCTSDYQVCRSYA
ncbi:hypothetical protein HZC07_01300 [Candidatus Micrarchaeota archaeon]|nr:hypothetical protein [Candidatus Micrarchaeota archaeon]